MPITKHMPDETVVDGTAFLEHAGETVRLHDFRDLDGNEMVLEAGACFKVAADVLRTLP